MPVEVRVTAVFQRLLGGAKVVSGQGSTVAQLLDNLEQQYPGFKGRITDENGDIHQFVNIYLNDEDIRFLHQLNTPLKEGDVISILPALAGG